jgi:tetratricopeptide (TPR) repeat protein
MVGLICVAMATASSRALAVPPRDDSTTPQTRAAMAAARHHAGVAAFAKGHYHDAIDLFLEADRLRPSAALSFNVARCYEQLQDASSALAWYRDYLRRSDHPSDAKQVARTIARLEGRLARRGVQQLTIDSSPHGATVLIDGKVIGASPWTGDLAPGAHSVDLTLPGFERVSQHFDLPRDHGLDIELALTREAAPQESMPQAAQAEAHDPASVDVEVPQAQTPRTFATVLPQRGESSTLSTLGWTALAAGGAALGGALTFELLRQGAEKDAQRETRQTQFAQDLRSMHARQTAARVLVGTGAALAVAGGVMLVVGAGHGERAPNARVALACASYRCQAFVTGGF